MDVRDLERALRRKLGAVEDRRRHHVFWWLEINEREYRVAKFSHSSRGQLPQYILADTAKRLKLTNSELDDLANCPLTGDEFRRLWAIR